MRVLFVSYLADPSSSGRQRSDALRALGHEVSTFALDGFEAESALKRKLRLALGGGFLRPEAVARAGSEFLAACGRTQPELVWAEKPLPLARQHIDEARTLLPRTLFACFQDDDPFGSRAAERPVWVNFVDAIPSYHIHFVKKRVNIEEFAAHGAAHVLLFMHGVHLPMFHPRSDLPAWAKREAVFVGAPLDHRVVDIANLLARGTPLDVYGNRWNRQRVYWQHRRRFHPAIVANDYALLLAGSKIGLGFVSSSNRDEYSMRSFEIPGSGALLLAERTPTHQALFDEGVDAEFFDSADECADKIAYYLRNETVRARVALRGYERCLRDGHLLDRRMAVALEQLAQLRHQLGL